MPLYYFHCAGEDTEGMDLPDDAAAREQARLAFGDMLRLATINGDDRMEVVDEQGRQVAVLSLRMS
jgi:hypothetical protein